MSKPFRYFNSSPEIIRLALIVPTRREDGIGPASAIGVRTRDGRRLSRELVPPQPGSASPPVAKPTGRDRSRPSSGMAADARARLSDPGRGIGKGLVTSTIRKWRRSSRAPISRSAEAHSPRLADRANPSLYGDTNCKNSTRAAMGIRLRKLEQRPSNRLAESDAFCA